MGHLNGNITLLEYFGDKHSFVDSTRTDGNGWFSLEMHPEAPAGLYSLAIGNAPLFNFIYNDEDIVLKYDPSGLSLPEFILSAENLIYYDYLVRDDNYRRKAGMLKDILQYYPQRDSFYLYTSGHFHGVQKAYREYTDKILSEYPQTLVSHIVRSDRPVQVPAGIDWKNYLDFNRGHYLDEVDFSDTTLMKTNVFTAKAIDYLGFYSLSGNNKELQEEYFTRAVDTLLHRAMVNGKVYDFLMQYLIEGFEMYGFDRVITHIAANYEPANSCVNEDRKSELQKRMESLRKLAAGNIAPDVSIVDAEGNKTLLSDIDNDIKVVLFWASWCPHCRQMIPGLVDLYNNPEMGDFELIAISIDTSASDYNEALQEFDTPWINYSDLKGWETKAATDYSIYATPTMFVLDRDLSILARPVSVSDLRIELIKRK
jgi:thiol-disulfide isomerase/thioredoxin